jgi:hypothetical protein
MRTSGWASRPSAGAEARDYGVGRWELGDDLAEGDSPFLRFCLSASYWTVRVRGGPQGPGALPMRERTRQV